MIHTLIPDIYKQIRLKDGWFTEELSTTFGNEVAKNVRVSMSDERPAPTLRLSQMGPKCHRALWNSIHHPELAEQPKPWEHIKFAYGHMIEALAIALAKASGHKVEGEQDELYVDGIKGHRDCVIDGHIVDVKSASSFSFQKFKDGSLVKDDRFGYLDQLDGYLLGSVDDPLVVSKDTGYLLAVDKTLGHMVLYEHKLREAHIRQRIAEYKRIVSLSSAPLCTCNSVPHQAGGNMKLDVSASYSYYKWDCFPQLRCFLYSDGPVYLSKVVKVPKVQEIDRNGKFIYNL